MLTIRPVEERTVSTWLELRNELIPDWPMVEEQVRLARLHEPLRLDFLAELDGRLVGGGVATRTATGGPDRGYTAVWVVPGDRRRGLGTDLLAHALEHCDACGLVHVSTLVRETNEAGIAFAGRHGYRETGRDVQLELDLSRALVRPVAPPPGIEIRPHRGEDDLESLWAIECETLPDVPGFEDHVGEPFPRWRDRAVGLPGYRPETFIVALADDEVVGFAQLRFAGAAEGAAEHEFTGVRRKWRGRGIAGALKRAQIAWAKEAGIAKLVTENEERNEPIRRTNEALGYAPTPAWLLLARDRSNQSE